MGKITSLREPNGAGVRIDGSIFAGFEASLHYDPLVAKLILWGESKAQAIRRMRRALREYKIIGLPTT